MDRLKQTLLEAEKDEVNFISDKVEVIGLSIQSCLNQAMLHLKTDLSSLDYEIIERGKKSFWNAKPYRLRVSLLADEAIYSEFEEFSVKLGVGERMLSKELDQFVQPKHRDGRVYVRIYRSGVYLTVEPPLGNGKPVDINQCLIRLQQSGVTGFDQSQIQTIVKGMADKPIRIGKWIPQPEHDSTVKVEITPDEMKAYIKVTPPRSGGKHLEVDEVINALKSHGVVIGFREEEISKALMEDRYMEEILAAQGQLPKHGDDAYIDYKVSIGKDHIEFDEDASGRVDFKQTNLIENVVAGQILAVKIPAKYGVPGKTMTNRMVEAKDGKDIELKQGRGTILSDDKMSIIAEINGQVVYANGRISVEPVHRVSGDVGPKTGNINFLGSVVVTGNVLDNYEIKAAGNIEVSGAVQKAKIEADGDIIVRQGIHGREEALVESTNGSVIAKFIQSAKVLVAADVIVQEGILHSRVEAGGKILCNGRRAQIVGGTIRATQEVRAKIIGSQAYTATEVIVGTDPRILAQYQELKEMLKEEEDDFNKTKKEVATLEARKKGDPDGFDAAQEENLNAKKERLEKDESKIGELKTELTQLEEYMQEIGSEGKVHVEKEIFPGVIVTIKDHSQDFNDVYRSVTLSYDKGYVKIGKLEKDEEASKRRK